MDIDSLRQLFPQLQDKVYGKTLVYLDNAATSLRPSGVVECWRNSAEHCTANLHRAVHHIADLATRSYEDARAKVASYIGAGSPSEIVFTSGATASINLVCYSFGRKFIQSGDEIIVAESEHHSNIVPWQMLCEEKGAKLRVWGVDENGHLSLDDLKSLLTPRTKLVCLAHISNVLGLVNPVKEVVKLCHSIGCKVLTDGAQGIVHTKVDVQDLDCDFYVFSGHKIFAAPSTGVLYAKKEILDSMPPFMGGGEMISEVKWSGTTYAEPPYRFEAGTQNISGTPTLKPALELMEEIQNSAQLSDNLKDITDYILSALSSDPRIRLYGIPGAGYEKVPVFSFSVEQLHHEDLALILDKMGVAVRSGQMCAEPLMDRYGVTGMLRASFAPYNTMQEARFFISSLHKAMDMLR